MRYTDKIREKSRGLKSVGLAAALFLTDVGAAAVNSTVNYDHPTNVSGAPDFFVVFLNQQTGGAWSAALVALSFGLVYLPLQGYNSRKAFAAASFSSFVFATLLSVFGVINGFIYSLTVIAVALAMIINHEAGGVAG